MIIIPITISNNQMLAKIAPRFVISRVIQTAYYADYMNVELAKTVIGESGMTYYLQNPKKFFECNFYGWISSLPPPTEFADQYEAQKYQESVKKLAVYNDMKAIYDKLNEFTLEVREYYRLIEFENSSHNFFSRPVETDPVLVEDIRDALHRYHSFLAKLQPFPLWKTKAIEEIGKWFLMIHNNLGESETKRLLFSEMNLQEYFV